MPTINLAEIKTRSLLWANRPEASSAKGEVYYFTDIGPNGSSWISNGEFWSPTNGEVVLVSNVLDYAVTGTTSETSLLVYTIPAGLISRVGQIDINIFGQLTTSANNKTFRVKLADVGTISGTSFYTSIFTASTNFQGFCSIKTNNSVSSQKSFGATSGSPAGVGTTVSSLITGTRNLNIANDLVITGELALSTESITLSSIYIVYRG